MKAEYDFSKGKQGRFYSRDANLIMPTSDEKPDWAGVESPLGKFVVEQARRTLNSYREQPNLVTEHANHERDAAHGGYARRQLFELVQNSADALHGAPNGKSILIRLTKRFLYCADNGNPIDEDGVLGLMFSYMSSKRNIGLIGRFGLGFKSVLGVSDAPEFYSRSGSFVFDKRSAAVRIAKVSPGNRYPVLRLPEPIDPHTARDNDDELFELMNWATNIVRLPIKPAAYSELVQQIRDFPPEFLLLVDHVRYLTLEDGESSRDVLLQERDGEFHLDTGDAVSRWKRFDTKCRLSVEARRDWPQRDNDRDVPIRWAVPLDRLERPGDFWAYFPTSTASLIAGMLNAPWKTNQDRQNLLPGSFNNELIEAAAGMIVDALPCLATRTDPARHLDALPRRLESGDSAQSELLRKHLFSRLRERSVVPDQDGVLRLISEISYPPKELTDVSDPAPFERWGAYPDRPRDWLHHKALNRNRLAVIDRLFPAERQGDTPTAPRSNVTCWLQALRTGDDVRASTAAIMVAAALTHTARESALGAGIVLTKSGTWSPPDPKNLFLPNEGMTEDVFAASVEYVHPELVSDSDTLSALKGLGLEPPCSGRRQP